LEPKIVEKASFHVVGMQFVGDNKQGGIPALWEFFLPVAMKHISPEGTTWYGICDCIGIEGVVCYTAGYEVPDLSNIPAGMIGNTVPANKYAVFTHHGPLSGLGATWGKIYSEWLPASGLERAEGPDFELYDERFKDDSVDSELDIYIPVK
jgi:AraC family transcriptional regulator